MRIRFHTQGNIYSAQKSFAFSWEKVSWIGYSQSGRLVVVDVVVGVHVEVVVVVEANPQATLYSPTTLITITTASNVGKIFPNTLKDILETFTFVTSCCGCMLKNRRFLARQNSTSFERFIASWCPDGGTCSP